MSNRLPLATRTMKARHPGTCALDGCSIFVGDRIGLIPGTGWARVICINARNRDVPADPMENGAYNDARRGVHMTMPAAQPLPVNTEAGS